LFEENGYAGLTPDWPGDTETVTEARESPTCSEEARKQIAE
jgi:hypothetical protein